MVVSQTREVMKGFWIWDILKEEIKGFLDGLNVKSKKRRYQELLPCFSTRLQTVLRYIYSFIVLKLFHMNRFLSPIS